MSERKVIRKIFWVWEFEKEEEWLNEMVMNGWKLVGVGFCRYTFEKCEPGEYLIRLEMHAPDADFIAFMEELGAQYVGHMVQWVYFCRKTELGAFDLFSDLDSRLAHLNKISRLLSAVGAMNIGIGLINVLNPIRCGWINLLCAMLLMYALGRIHGKRENLLRERSLHE